MGTNQNTITINGKVYDINKGQVVKDTAQTNHAKPVAKGSVHPSRQVSDIIRPSKTSSPVNRKIAPSPKPKSHTHPAASHSSVNPAKRKPAKAQTLARNYVKKPTQSKPTAANTRSSVPRVVALHKSVDHNRLTRAEKIHRSNNVSKFGGSGVRPITKKVDHIDVVPEPKPDKKHYDISHTPPVMNSYGRSKPRHKADSANDIFESALSKSKSHRQTYTPKKSHHRKGRWASIAAGSLTAVLLIAFFVYQNLPSIALYTSSSQVGFAVVKPSYQPAGYGFKGTLKSEPGKVVLNFRSNSDDKHYTIEQTKTELDSASLLNDYLANKNTDFSTEYANGRTVYLYGDNNATWVDGGVWYNLSNQASLTNDQLLKIVSSI